MLIAYLFISVLAGMLFAGFTLAGGHGMLLALLFYWLGGTMAFVLTMWLAAAVYPRRWEPFPEQDFQDGPSKTADAAQGMVTD